MEFYISGLYDAIEFIPSEPTYALRINNSGAPSHKNCDYQKDFRLKDSGLWVAVNEYVFDDIRSMSDEDRMSGVVISDEIANNIVLDIIPFISKCSSVLIHCHGGFSRSPAVAMAFNRIFGLGYRNRDLFIRYPDYNKLVYETIVKANDNLLIT